MQGRSVLLALLLALGAVTVIPTIPNAAADGGDVLRDAGNNILTPGNPCNAQGPHGGVAVNGAAGRLYYTTRDDAIVHVTTTTAPFTCVGSFPVAGVPGTVGFRRLAYDAFSVYPSGLLWAVPDDGSGRAYGIRLDTMTVVTSYQHPTGAVDLNGIAVEQVSPYRNIAAAAWSSIARYFDDNGNDLGAVTLATVPGGVRGLATWSGALLAGDAGYTLRFHDASGVDSGRSFRPHLDYVDEFYQPAKTFSSYWWDDVALDAVSYAGSGKVALFTIQGFAFSVCVDNCPSNVCDQWDNEGRCIHTVPYCDGVPGACTGPPVYEPGGFSITIRAHQVPVDPACPDPLDDCAASDPCDPPSLAPVLVQVAPLARVYVEDQDTGAPHVPALAYGDAITLRFTDPAGTVGKSLEISGPIPGLPVTLPGPGGDWTYPLSLASAAPGIHTLTAVSTDTTDPCAPPTAVAFRLQVAKPYLESYAQNVRVSGNLPTDLVIGTAPQDPQQILLGREYLRIAGWQGALVVPNTATVFAQVPASAEAVSALAEYAPAPGGPVVAASHARTEVADLFVGPGNGAFCPAPPNLCGAFGTPGVQADLLVTDSVATVNVDTLAPTTQTESVVMTGLALDACDVLLLLVGSCEAGVDTAAGSVEVFAHERWTREGRGWAEAYANLARITIDAPPWRGEIVLGESYAAASVVGTAPLLGRPAFMEDPHDYGLGIDAPATGGPNLAPGAYSGMFLGADTEDAFRVTAAPLEKIQVVLSPAHRAESYADTVPTPPTGQVTPRRLVLELRDPAGNLRDSTFVAFPQSANARPAKVELNVDVAGDWRVVVKRLDTGEEHAYYGIAVAVTPLVHTAFDVHPTHAAAPSGCPSGMDAPVHPFTGWLDETQTADVWRLSTAPGDRIVVALKPAYDLDGADFDLQLLDASCAVVASSATAGGGLVSKGTPESVNIVTPGGGTYYAKVVRANAVGNYLLDATVVGP